MACVLEPVPDRRHGEVQLGGERRALLLARLFGSWLEGPDSPHWGLIDGQEREVQPAAVPLVQGAAQAVRQRGRVLAPRRPAGPPLPGGAGSYIPRACIKHAFFIGARVVGATAAGATATVASNVGATESELHEPHELREPPELQDLEVRETMILQRASNTCTFWSREGTIPFPKGYGNFSTPF